MNIETNRYGLLQELNEEYCLSTKIVLNGDLSLVVQHGPNYVTPYFILIKGDPAYQCILLKMCKLVYIHCDDNGVERLILTKDEQLLLNHKLTENSCQLWKFILYEQTLATMFKKDKDYCRLKSVYYKYLTKIPDYTQLPE